MGLSSIAARRPRVAARSATLPAARLALVLTSVLVPILTFELLLRAFGAFLPGNYDTGAYLTRHPGYGHYHPPNYSGWIKRDEYLVHVRTNPAGQRGRDVPVEKPSGVFRILVLGDSFVEAVQVAEHERFVARLEQLLNGSGASRRFEVIDGGCGGWGTAQEYLYLRDDGVRYAPDLVLLAFFVGNDVANNSLDLELDGRIDQALKPYFRLNAGNSLELVEPNPPPLTPLEQLALGLRERSTLYNVVETGVLQKLSLDDQWATWRDLDAAVELLRHRDEELFRTSQSEQWERAWVLTERLIETVKALAGAHGSEFAMVGIPTRTQVDDGAWRELAGRDGGRRAGLERYQPSKQLEEIAERTRTPFVDLLSAFQRAHNRSGAQPLYFERDQHWTAAGHAFAAERIAEFLRSNDLLED
jgi:lysophospholipase L1-like esterase